MPTYEYICNNCGYEFELFQSMTAPVKRKCPECNKLKLERLIGTGAAVIFKGGGFYETDYRSDSYKKGAEAEKKAKEDKTKKDADSKKPKDRDTSKKPDSKKTDTSTTKKKPSTKSKD